MKQFFHWIILYDIKNQRRLARVAKLLESYAIRVQYSVFETDADDTVVAHIKKRLAKIIKPDEDTVLILPLCESDYGKQERHGRNIKLPLHQDGFQIL